MMKKSKRYISGKKRNRRAAFKNRLMKVMLLAAILILVFCGFKTKASTQKDESYSYKTITVDSGDSLWSIASEYADQSDDGIDTYIKNLKQMNALKNEEIRAGQTLVIYYYE